ncbi:MAG: hypothetical protein HQL94_03740 [Magnetococcales bacterium]|nr:hypothetical protein [Magnetococcales bacterium]
MNEIKNTLRGQFNPWDKRTETNNPPPINQAENLQPTPRPVEPPPAPPKPSVTKEKPPATVTPPPTPKPVVKETTQGSWRLPSSNVPTATVSPVTPKEEPPPVVENPIPPMAPTKPTVVIESAPKETSHGSWRLPGSNILPPVLATGSPKEEPLVILPAPPPVVKTPTSPPPVAPLKPTVMASTQETIKIDKTPIKSVAPPKTAPSAMRPLPLPKTEPELKPEEPGPNLFELHEQTQTSTPQPDQFSKEDHARFNTLERPRQKRGIGWLKMVVIGLALLGLGLGLSWNRRMSSNETTREEPVVSTVPPVVDSTSIPTSIPPETIKPTDTVPETSTSSVDATPTPDVVAPQTLKKKEWLVSQIFTTDQKMPDGQVLDKRVAVPLLLDTIPTEKPVVPTETPKKTNKSIKPSVTKIVAPVRKVPATKTARPLAANWSIKPMAPVTPPPQAEEKAVFVVSYGCFSNEKEINLRAEKIKARGWPVLTSQYNIAQTTMTCLFGGPFGGPKDADQATELFEEKGCMQIQKNPLQTH